MGETNNVQRWYIKRGRFERLVVSILLPIAASFYSRRMALILGVPCAIVFWWNARRAYRSFVNNERLKQ